MTAQLFDVGGLDLVCVVELPDTSAYPAEVVGDNFGFPGRLWRQKADHQFMYVEVVADGQ